jgi:hypothetical protein
MRYAFSIVAILVMNWGYSQLLEENTNVLTKIQGDNLFSLNADEQVYTFEPDGGWYKIRKEVYVDPAFVTDKKYIAAATDLTNQEGEKIGSTLAEIKVVEGAIEKKYRGQERFKAIIEGYVFKTKIKDDSHPEERITKLLANKSRSQQTEGFKELFKDYGFEEREFGEFQAYAFREVNKTLADEKDFRVIVVYRGEGNVYAVITNSQTVGAPKVKSSWEDSSYKVIYMYKPTASQSEVIQDEILYTFIGL